MAHLDVYRLESGGVALDCQSDQLDQLSTRFTVPLLPPDKLPSRIDRIHPVFSVAGVDMVMATHLAGAVPAHALKTKIGSLSGDDYAVQRALDSLTGTA